MNETSRRAYDRKDNEEEYAKQTRCELTQVLPYPDIRVRPIVPDSL